MPTAGQARPNVDARTGPFDGPVRVNSRDRDAEEEDVLVGTSGVAVPRVRPGHVHHVAARRGRDARVVAEEALLAEIRLRARVVLSVTGAGVAADRGTRLHEVAVTEGSVARRVGSTRDLRGVQRRVRAIC